MFKIETGENNPILRRVADPVTKNNLNEVVKLGKKMLKYIKNPDNGGIGLAAPQIGQSVKLVVLGLPKTREDEHFKFVMMLNPEITEYGEETEIDEEGCLSIPGVREEVERPTKIKVVYMDEKMAEKTLILEGLQARIVQHELDHINGKLFIDYVK